MNIPKQKEIYRYREQTSGYCEKRKGGRGNTEVGNEEI